MKFRKTFAAVFVLCMVFIMTFSVVCNAADDSTEVIYEGEAEKFVFIPESTDLFRNFKNLYPGDSINQNIKITNNDNTAVSVYLRAEDADKKYCDFLDNINLLVSMNDGTVISNSKASSQKGLNDNILLAKLSPNETTNLKVLLSADKKIDNRFQNAFGEVRWIFSVRKDSENSQSSFESSVVQSSVIQNSIIQNSAIPASVSQESYIFPNIKTGDSGTSVFLQTGILIFSSLLIAVLMLAYRKKYPK